MRRQYIYKSLFLMFTILLSAVILNTSQTHASSKSTDSITLKVGFYELDGFFYYDSTGKEAGYGVDYLSELAKYADININFEYVHVDSWEDLGPMMKAGDIDLEMPVSAPSTPSEYFSYTTEDIMSSYHAIMTKTSRDDLYYDDYDTLSTLKIAATKGLLERTGTTDYLKSIGVYKNLIMYDDYNSCKKALNNGTADALISNVMDLTDDMKILSKFCVTDNYIITLKDSPYYTIINQALTNLKLSEPSFENDLFEKYYPERSFSPFTKEESNYISKTKTLTVATYTDYRPISYYDYKSETFKGIAIDMMKKLSKKTGIKFKFVAIDTSDITDMLNYDNVDLVMPININSRDKLLNCFKTKNLFDSNIKFIVNDANTEIQNYSTIGILDGYGYLNEAMLDSNNTYNISTYASVSQALKALKKGQIAAYASIDYSLNYLLESPRYKGYTILNYDEIPVQFCLGGKNNTVIESVLNKGIQQITDAEFNNIVAEDTAYNWRNIPLTDKLYSYRVPAICTGITLIVILIGVLLYTVNRSKYIHKIEQKSQEAVDASNAKTDFLSRMSHEIRTPMNAILGMAAIAQENNDVSKKEECIGQIIDSGEYLLQLINDILDMSRIEQNKITLNEEFVDGPAFLNSLVDMLTSAAKENGITLKTDFGKSQTPWVKMDTLRSKQIYVNLLNNAIKFSPKGSTVDWTIIDTPTDDTHINMVCTIKDHGCGMSKEFQKRMFLPFEQEHNQYSDKTPGTGLGLPIVKNLIEIMGGSIQCDSEINEGTTFTFTLTREMRMSKPNNAKDNTSYEESVLKDKEILLAEDNEINAQVAIQILEHYGMNVTWAGDGQEALDIFLQSSTPFDLILMDVRMPRIDGLQATKIIRNSTYSNAHTIPIVAMTADAFDEDMHKTRDAGMNAHLTKPIEIPKFLSTLTELLK